MPKRMSDKVDESFSSPMNSPKASLSRKNKMQQSLEIRKSFGSYSRRFEKSDAVNKDETYQERKTRIYTPVAL